MEGVTWERQVEEGVGKTMEAVNGGKARDPLEDSPFVWENLREKESAGHGPRRGVFIEVQGGETVDQEKPKNERRVVYSRKKRVTYRQKNIRVESVASLW